MLIAVLDSDRDQVELLRQELTHAGHACQAFRHPRELLAALGQSHFEALVMDGKAGEPSILPTLQAIRSIAPADLPILLLAQRTHEKQLAEALAGGTTDYIVKPLRRGEFQLRMQVLLARAYPGMHAGEEFCFGPFTFEPDRSRITRADATIDVTQKEFELALLFFRNLGRPLSRAYILEKIWSHDTETPSRTIDTHVSRVRNKLGLRPENGFRLVPVYSYGYQLEQLPAR
ncbi:MAG TPA: response regulator transcription factor [Noviherbaspirillum sp.]|uniref:response regulator transcription factor n=1 Tax=Noviherbaspirillum sp. TaxID=1926288 RepID=UPI002B485F28|nr:response regulator transcription factor [Noviherbaspirillum sp.]HJV86798.1 response regulator transcription factor [Noviherbaspirillum sp.]